MGLEDLELGNAIKYSQPNTRVRVQVARRHDWVEVEFQDQGPGLPADKLESIFEPFQRAESHGQKGSGLGLAIARRIVAGHDGKLWATSQLGQGSTFHLHLPLPVRSDR